MQHGKLNRLSEAFHALGHPTKLRLLQYVVEHGEDPEHPIVPTMAAAILDIPVARAGYHLKRLSEVGLLHRHVTGRYAFYSVNGKLLDEIKEFFQ
jgi:DNA-binding transcriptional ArsR family regulator